MYSTTQEKKNKAAIRAALTKSDSDWRCIASDYSVQYKLMHKRYQPLHTNNISMDIQNLKVVGDCKVADITRCAYTKQEGQYIRVSVHAKLVFMQ